MTSPPSLSDLQTGLIWKKCDLERGQGKKRKNQKMNLKLLLHMLNTEPNLCKPWQQQNYGNVGKLDITNKSTKYYHLEIPFNTVAMF
uniref:Uncharacterized protein n=1 Tax=Strigamia maritima TaxID=126957 RepID=T1JJP8_STRMM